MAALKSFDTKAWLGEHHSAIALLESQRVAKKQATHDQPFAKRLAKDLLDKLKRTKGVQNEHGEEMTRAITEGPWDEPDTAAMCAAIADQVMGTMGKSAPTRETQECQLELFLRESDWAYIEDMATPMTPKFAQMRKFLLAIELPLPSENLQARLANLYRFRACRGGDDWSPLEWRTHLDRFKKAIAPNKKALLANAFMDPYPMTPAELQEKAPLLYAKVYASEGPALRECAEMGDVPFMRSTHSAYKESPPSTGKKATSTDWNPAEQFQKTAEALAGLFGARPASAFVAHGASWSESGSPQWSRRSWSQSSNQRWAGWADTHASWAPAEPDEASGFEAKPENASIEDDEHEMREALARRKEETLRLAREKAEKRGQTRRGERRGRMRRLSWMHGIASMAKRASRNSASSGRMPSAAPAI